MMAHGTPVRAYRHITPEELAEAIRLVYVHHLSKAAAARHLGVPPAALRQRLRVYNRGWARDAAARAVAITDEPPRPPRYGTILASLAPDHPVRLSMEQGANWIAPEFTIVDEDGSVGFDLDTILARVS